MVDCCRFFGGSPEYWWHNLTLRRLRDMERSLRRVPPVEYFKAAQYHYQPPSEISGEDAKKPEPLPLYE